MKPILFLFFAGLLSLNAMAANRITFTHYAWIQQTPSMELYIDAKGKIFANGKILSTKTLEKKLSHLDGMLRNVMAILFKILLKILPNLVLLKISLNY